MKKRLAILFFSLLLIWSFSKIDWGSRPICGCPFCQPQIIERQLIISGDLASVIATNKPAVPGHVLVIPNRHVESFDQLNSQEITEIGDLIKRVHHQYITRLNATDYLLLEKNGPLSGRSVPHIHIHVLPRTKEISIYSFILRFLTVPYLKPLNDQEMKEFIQAIGACGEQL